MDTDQLWLDLEAEMNARIKELMPINPMVAVYANFEYVEIIDVEFIVIDSGEPV